MGEYEESLPLLFSEFNLGNEAYLSTSCIPCGEPNSNHELEEIEKLSQIYWSSCREEEYYDKKIEKLNRQLERAENELSKDTEEFAKYETLLRNYDDVTARLKLAEEYDINLSASIGERRQTLKKKMEGIESHLKSSIKAHKVKIRNFETNLRNDENALLEIIQILSTCEEKEQ